MKLVLDPHSDKRQIIYRWMHGDKQLATIALYPEGLVEFTDPRIDLILECVGREGETLSVNGLAIQPE